MEIDRYRFAIYGGTYYSKETAVAPEMSESPLVQLKTSDLTPRFVVQLGDGGFDPLGLQEGDHLIFRSQRWPTKDEQICFCVIGDECIIRMLDGVLAHDIQLRVPRDTYKPIEVTPQDFHVMGVLAGLMDRDEPIYTVSQEDLYFGVAE